MTQRHSAICARCDTNTVEYYADRHNDGSADFYCLDTQACNIAREAKLYPKVLIHVEDADEVYFYTDHVQVHLSYDHKYVNLTDDEFHAMQDGGCVEVDFARLRTIPGF